MMLNHRATPMIAVLLLLLFQGLYAQPPNSALPWRTVFVDEFHHAPLDINLWCRDDWRRFKFNRHDLMAFRTTQQSPPDNLEWHSIGNLNYVTQIVMEEQRVGWVDDITVLPDNNYVQHTFEYSAPARMVSMSKYKYGYFEIRCKLPVLSPTENNLGFGANFWLRMESPPPAKYPQSEIDIFEFICNPNQSQVQTCNAHQWPTLGVHIGDDGYEGPPIDFGEFHTFGVWWGSDFIRYYRDGVNYKNAIPSVSQIADEMIPMRIILDINVFTGHNGETPNANTKIPYKFDIDYVRVYQLETCNPPITICNPASAQQSVFEEITLGGGGCIFGAGNSESLWSQTSTTILPGFQADLGSELVLDITPFCHESLVFPCSLCSPCD